jgi:hypothetical protein
MSGEKGTKVTLQYLLAENRGLKGLYLHPGAEAWLKLIHGRPEGAASLDACRSGAFDADWRRRVDGQCYRGLVQVYAVVTWRIVLASMAGLTWHDEVELRRADGRRWCCCRRVRHKRSNLRLGGGTRPAKVVRKRGPVLSEASGSHTRNHSHDVSST